MTLFLKATRDYICEEISHINKQSSEDDKNILKVYFGGRKTDLSKLKQAKLSGLKTSLDNLIPAINDEQSKLQVERLLKACKTETEELIRDKRASNPGKSKEFFDKVIPATDNFYSVCQDLELLNTQYDAEDPLNILQKAIITYIVKRAEIGNALRADKKNAAKDSLKAIANAVLNKTKVERIPLVQQAINALQATNLNLCQENVLGLELPLFMSGFTIPLTRVPNDGDLAAALEDARENIKNIANKLKEEATSLPPNNKQALMASTDGIDLQDEKLSSDSTLDEQEEYEQQSVTQKSQGATDKGSTPPPILLSEADFTLLGQNRIRSKSKEDAETEEMASCLEMAEESLEKVQPTIQSNNPFASF